MRDGQEQVRSEIARLKVAELEIRLAASGAKTAADRAKAAQAQMEECAATAATVGEAIGLMGQWVRTAGGGALRGGADAVTGASTQTSTTTVAPALVLLRFGEDSRVDA